jgi:hypothetical protein
VKRVRLSGGDYPPPPGPVTEVVYWFDRTASLWTIQARDANKYQIGDVQHTARGLVNAAESLANAMSMSYGDVPVRRLAPGDA